MKTKLFSFPLLLVCLILWVTGCTPTTNAPLLPSHTPTSEIQISAPVISARDAVLDFMREGAIISVPGQDAPWHADLGSTIEGFQVYQFSGNSVFLTVSYPDEETADTIYHVTFNNSDIGVCWQANTDSKGNIVSTGLQASMFPELVTAASTYCQEQGYQYAKNPKDEENQCGTCSFPDGSACNAWAYYQGFCQPGTSTEGG